jgi:hypothetical protein
MRSRSGLVIAARSLEVALGPWGLSANIHARACAARCSAIGTVIPISRSSAMALAMPSAASRTGSSGSFWLKRIDAWRRHQPNLPSRSEAIRRLVEIGLETEGRGEKKPKA